MEMLKSKSLIVLTIMILGVSYISALDNVNASHSAQNVKSNIVEMSN